MSGIHADTITGEDGQTYQRSKTGDGYINTKTGKGVSQAKVARAAEQYLRADTQFKAELEDDLYFDIRDKTYNQSTGEYDQMNYSDLKSYLPDTFIEKGAEMLGIPEGADIEATLEAKGIAPEQIYRAIKGEQKLQEAIAPTISKEAYTEYTDTFNKDWLLADSIKASKAKQKEANIRAEFGTISTISVKSTTTADDLAVTSKLYSNANTQLKQLNKDLNNAKAKKSNPYDIRKIENDIKEQTRIIDATINKQSKNLNVIPGIKEEIAKIINKDFPTTSVNGVSNNPLEHTKITYAPLQKLIFKSLSGEDITEDVSQYIEGTFDEDQAREDYKSYAENNKYNNRKITEDLYVKNKREGFAGKLKNEAIGLKDKIDTIAKKASDTLKKDPLSHTQSYGSYALPEMSAEDRRNNPASIIEDAASNIVKNNKQYYRQATESGTGLDVETYLGQQYDFDQDDIADGDVVIDWANSTTDSIIDLVQDSEGNYKPAISIDVDIDNDGTKINAKIISFIDEPSYNEKSKETTEKYKNDLVKKRNLGSISNSENILLDRLTTNMFDGTKYGKTFPTSQLYNAESGAEVKVPFQDGSLPMTVEVSTKGEVNSNSNGMSYYLKDPKGMYYATDSNGKSVTVTKEQLGPDADGHYEYTPVGAETPYDLKVKMGNLLYSNDSTKRQDTVNITSVFNSDIKDGVDPELNKEVLSFAQNIKTEFPSLFVTDAYREENAGYGAKDSKHKKGKALDFRLNDDAMALTNLSDREKRLMGIKSAAVHNGDHVHLEFL